MSKEFEEYKKYIEKNGRQGHSAEIDMFFSHHAALELAEQKATLIELLKIAEDKEEIIKGVIYMIDTIQDQLHDFYGYPADVVFPFEDKFPNEVPEVIDYRVALQALLKSLSRNELPLKMNINPELTKVIKKLFKGEKI